ncbi:hypothetical protein F1880_003883, partial [Penicillium rolfsii]
DDNNPRNPFHSIPAAPPSPPSTLSSSTSVNTPSPAWSVAMSRNFFPVVMAIGVGIFTGYYTFQPTFQQMAIEKDQLPQQRKSTVVSQEDTTAPTNIASEGSKAEARGSKLRASIDVLPQSQGQFTLFDRDIRHFMFGTMKGLVSNHDNDGGLSNPPDYHLPAQCTVSTDAICRKTT